MEPKGLIHGKEKTIGFDHNIKKNNGKESKSFDFLQLTAKNEKISQL